MVIWWSCGDLNSCFLRYWCLNKNVLVLCFDVVCLVVEWNMYSKHSSRWIDLDPSSDEESVSNRDAEITKHIRWASWRWVCWLLRCCYIVSSVCRVAKLSSIVHGWSTYRPLADVPLPEIRAYWGKPMVDTPLIRSYYWQVGWLSINICGNQRMVLHRSITLASFHGFALIRVQICNGDVFSTPVVFRHPFQVFSKSPTT